MSAMKMIDTIAGLVDAFGGTNAMAEWADVPPSAVSNWKAQEAIPRGYHLDLFFEIRARKLKVSPRLFGKSKWPDEAEPKQRSSDQPVLSS